MSRLTCRALLPLLFLVGAANAATPNATRFATVQAAVTSTAPATTPELPSLPPRISLWANNRTMVNAIEWSGSSHESFGLIHSNAGIKLSGSGNVMRAGTRYVTQLNVSGSNNQFLIPPQRVSAQDLPFTVDIDSYRPGGTVQQAVGASYFDKTATCQQSGKWQLNQQDFPLAPGVHWVPCDIQISGSNLTARVTFASTGKLQISGSSPRFTPFYRGVQFASSATAADAFKFSGSSGEAAGLIWAPNGLIEASGSNWKFACGIVADRIKASGSGTRIGTGACGSAPTTPAVRNVTTPEDTALAIELTAQDIDQDLVRFEVTVAPVHGTLTGIAPALTYTPHANFFGSDTFAFRAVDSFGQVAMGEVAIAVTAVNDRPIAAGQSLTVAEDDALPIALSAFDVEGTSLTFAISTPPAHGTLTGTGSQRTYTPAPNFAGIDSFTFTARDESLESLPATVSITVTPIDDAPVAQSQEVAATEDLPIAILLTATGGGGGALQFAIVQSPAHGSLAGSGADRLYTPANNHFGQDEFVFRVTATSGESSTARVGITVAAVNDAPTAGAISLAALAGQPLAVNLSGVDIDGDALTFRVVRVPAHGVATGTPPDLTYTAESGFTGADSLEYVANDGYRDSTPALVSIAVTSGNRAPEIVSAPPLSVDENAPFAYDVEATDPDGDVLAFSHQLPIAPATIDVATGLLSANLPASAVQSMRALNTSCRLPSQPLGTLAPVIKWHWDDNKSLGVPAVGPLFDTNNDGAINGHDRASMVILSFDGFIDGDYGAPTILDAATGELQWTTSALNLQGKASSHATIADLEGDGSPEIIYYGENEGTIVLRADGSLKWRSVFPGGVVFSPGAPSVADLDGDGRAEVLTRTHVLNADGSVRFQMTNTSISGTFPVAVDLDLDGDQEVVLGNRAVDKSGAVLWTSSLLNSGPTGHAVGNLDDDPFPEIVVATHDAMLALNHDGSLLWRHASPVFSSGGPPSIADLDGDGVAEIIALRTELTVFRANGLPLWEADIFDGSNGTGSTAFDFNGDGRLEIVYADENFLRVFDGPSGRVLHEIPNGSATANEFPIVVDVDGDGHAEIVASSDGFGTPEGVRVYESADNSWMPARKVWSEYAYSVDNVNDDLSIPRQPARGWQTHNTFRVNSSASPLDQPDLALFDLRLDESSRTAITITVRNRGLAPTSVTSQVRLHNGAGGTLLGTVDVPTLASGESRALRLEGLSPQAVSTDLHARIDASNAIVECAEDNNHLTAPLLQVQASDPVGLSDTQRFTVVVDNVNAAPTLEARSLPNALLGVLNRATLDAHDPDLGEGLRFTLIDPPIGLIIEPVTGELRWIPVTPQVGTHSIRVRVTDLGGLADERTYTVTVPANLPPLITSTPIPTSTTGHPYRYPVIAVDPEGQTLNYRFTARPPGMTIGTVSGVIEWDPLIQHDGHPVRVVVTDGHGGEAAQQYAIDVRANQVPVIHSTPITHLSAGQAYRHDVDASDADGDELTYTLAAGPAGMTIDPVSGVIDWPTSANASSTQNVQVTVRDGAGGATIQSFTLTVSSAGNLPPTITSIAATQVRAGSAYRYDVDASDPEGDSLSYALETAPVGMQVSTDTGLIDWTPTAAQVGTHPVRVEARDGRSGTAVQTYAINVAAAGSNNAPIIDSVPVQNAKVGREYRYDLRASDADEDLLTYSLEQSPSGMTIDATGRIRWMPTVTGPFPIKVRASDAGGFARQEWTLLVVAANVLLDPIITITPVRPEPGDIVTIEVRATGAAGALTIDATLDAAPLTLDINGRAQRTFTEFAPHTVSATVSDGHDTVTETATFNVVDPNALPAVVDLITPADGGEVTKPTSIRAAITGGPVSSWVLGYRASNSPTAALTILAQGIGTFSARDVASFDPTLLINGQYVVILQATDTAGRTGVDSAAVTVDGDFKVGQYSVTFEDVSIPVAGIPITVSRTYDTRQRSEALDFGHGWSIDYQNVRVRESGRMGFAWQLIQNQQGPFSTFCVGSNGDRVVTVTLPDGEVEKFRAVAHSPNGTPCQQLAAFTDVTLHFEAIDGTDTTLAQNSYGALRIATIAGSGATHIVDAVDPSSPVDPSLYTLTTPEGFVYSLDQDFGIRKVTEPSGNTLTYSADGIEHSSGLGVSFERDVQGRITDIVLPDGEVLSYTYTANGDLEAFVDQVDNTTRFAYTDSRFPHYLTEITDPRGVRALRNEYDDQGRLIRTIDAAGHTLVYSHSIAARTERVTDRRGIASTYQYDDEGRVLAEFNGLNQVTRHTYDADGNELTRTDPLGHVTTMTYDARGNALTEVNDLGETVVRTYDSRNALLTQRDARGVLVMTNTYSERTGALTATVDALGHASGFAYDSGIGSGGSGELVAMTDALSHATTYELASFTGWRKGETDALGHRTAYTYDAQGRVLTETRTRSVTPAGGGSAVIQSLVTSYTYDAKGRVTRTDLPDGSFSTTEYNAIDRPVRECDALTRCTTHVYDARGELSSTTYPDGTTESKTFDPNGNLLTQTDRGGRITKFVYDAAKRLTQTIHPDATPAGDGDNPRTRSVYDSAGRLVISTNENNESTTYAYDAANRQVSVTDAHDHVTRTEYDLAGRKTAMIDALDRRTAYFYDSAGRVTQTVFADAATTGTEYDALGRKTADIDESGTRRTYGYDALGRLTTVTLAAGTSDATTTTYAYDELGNKVTQTDALGRETKWTYDSVGRETTRTLPLGQVESFEYDVVGRRTAHIDFKGQRTTVEHDLADRPTLTTYADGRVETRSYDDVGNRTAQTSPEGIQSWAFDARNRMTRQTQPNGVVFDYEYDRPGNRTLSRYTIGSGTGAIATTTLYSFDAVSRLTQTQRGSVVIVYGYDAVGNRTSERQGPITTTNAFDARNRVISIESRRGVATVQRYAYTLDATGKRTRIEETDSAGVAHTITYTYDRLNRLTGEARSRAGAVIGSSGFGYDSVGNRVAVVDDEIVRSATFNENDQLLIQGGETFAYDPNGNQATKASVSGTVAYVYDARDKLLSATDSASGARTSFVYDADGNRTERRTRTSTTASEVLTRFVVDSNFDLPEVVAERNEAANAVTHYLHAHDLALQTTAAPGSSSTHYTLRDGLGSTRYLADLTGAVTDTLRYSAWGEPQARIGTTNVAHQFAGESWEPSLGLSYNRARFYSPSQARFTQHDAYLGEAMDPMSQARYAYGHSNPVLNTDPSGHASLVDSMAGASGGAILRAGGLAILSQAALILGYEHANTRQRYKIAAESCARSIAMTALTSRSPCGLNPYPMVFMREMRIPAITQHVAASQAAGSPMTLHRTGNPIKIIQNRGHAYDKCRLGQAILPAAGGSCDEYPFASTYEGGPAATVRHVPLTEQYSQGGTLSIFYTLCGIVPEVPGLQDFLVVPVTSADRSFSCGRFPF